MSPCPSHPSSVAAVRMPPPRSSGKSPSSRPTLEALEDPSHRFALGVLWHPEAGEDMRLFEALVEEAGRYREERH